MLAAGIIKNIDIVDNKKEQFSDLPADPFSDQFPTQGDN